MAGECFTVEEEADAPLSTREPIHLVMRSSWAKGLNSFLQPRNKNKISHLIQIIAKKYSVRVYQVANAGNHLHLIIRAPHRKHYKTFVRVLSSQIAIHIMRGKSFTKFKQLVQSQEAGDPHPGFTELLGLSQQFWQFRPWTRVLFWGRDFKTCCRYVVQNTLEALGFIEFVARRKDSYSKWLSETTPRFKKE